jgi:outer membrane beta-barrel protein
MVLASGVARADEDERVATYAVQNRKYKLGHELNLSVGVLPLNAFTKGVPIGGGYTYHFNDLIAWEVAQFYYSFGTDTGLKDSLVSNFGVSPTSEQFGVIDYFGSTNFVLKPMYGKYALFNRWVVHTEFFIALGPAFSKFINPAVFRAGFDAGFGIRLWLMKYFSLRLDVRDYTFFAGSSPKSDMHIALSLALSFGGHK